MYCTCAHGERAHQRDTEQRALDAQHALEAEEARRAAQAAEDAAEEAERAALERIQRADAESRAKCPTCWGHGTHDEHGETLVCSCEYGKAEGIRQLHEIVPKRFHTATADDIPAGTATDGGLLIYGPVGTGKTHLAVAILYANIGKHQPHDMLFCAVPDLLDEIRATYNGQGSGDIQTRVQSVPVLVLDDFGTERVTDWVREKVYQIVNRRYNDCLTTIVTTNLPPSKLAGHVGERTASRLMEMCAVVRLQGHDRRTERAREFAEGER